MNRLAFVPTVKATVKFCLLFSMPYMLFVLAVMNGFGVSVIPAETSSKPQVAGASTESTAMPLTEMQIALLAEVNRARQAVGVEPVTPLPLVQRAAQQRLNDMMAESYYAHKSPTGQTYTDLLDQNFAFSCENLNMSYAADAGMTVQDWLESDAGHRECLLHPYARWVGIDTKQFSSETQQYITVLITASVR